MGREREMNWWANRLIIIIERWWNPTFFSFFLVFFFWWPIRALSVIPGKRVIFIKKIFFSLLLIINFSCSPPTKYSYPFVDLSVNPLKKHPSLPPSLILLPSPPPSSFPPFQKRCHLFFFLSPPLVSWQETTYAPRFTHHTWLKAGLDASFRATRGRLALPYPYQTKPEPLKLHHFSFSSSHSPFTLLYWLWIFLISNFSCLLFYNLVIKPRHWPTFVCSAATYLM